MIRRLFILTALAVAPVLAETLRHETVEGDRIVVIDGDTLALPCRRADCTGPERIRLLNIDAPEIRSPACAAEEDLGWRAKEALARLLRGRAVAIHRCEAGSGRCVDRYGRTLATLTTETGDVGQALIASGHALPWAPGAEAKAGRQSIWCDPDPEAR